LNRAGASLVFAGVTACARSTTASAPPATVYFQLDAPLCSSIIPVVFSIDRTDVGTDTFRVHLANEHVISRGFDVTPGTHLLGARMAQYRWPDSSATVSAGQQLTRSLPLYCS
jgi:hypothetical protein